MKLNRADDISVKLSGLASCDSCRRARRWFAQKGVDVAFRDLREEAPTPDELGRWSAAVGWDALLNRRSTTWRGLPAAQREGLDEVRAIALMAAHPTLVKRPVVEAPDGLVVGVDESAWTRVLGA